VNIPDGWAIVRNGLYLGPMAAARVLACIVIVVLQARGQPDPHLASALGSRGVQGSNQTSVQIVTLRPGVDLDGLVKEHGLKPHHVYHHALHGFAAPMDTVTINRLKQDSRVLAVEADGRVIPCAQTVPAGVIRMGVTNFPVAHINGQDNRINVDVAVMDTGIQTNHPDLNVVQAVDFTGSGLNGDDWDGHGTHVAGTIGALDNDFGVVGVAPGARLWSVQVIGPSGGTWSEFIAGADYIATNADTIAVVNCSLSSDGSMVPYIAVHTAVSNLVNLGIVFVAAAGNFSTDLAGNDYIYGTDDDILPAALPEVMAVSSMDPESNYFSVFTDYCGIPDPAEPVNDPGGYPGNCIDLAAPGEGILSTYINSGYATLDGTSMACAHASGLVALYIAANGRAHSAQDVYLIRQTLINTGLPQSHWGPPSDGDPDSFHEPLAVPSESWVPTPTITGESITPGGFQLSFPAVPGYNYTVQCLSSLGSSMQWTNLTTMTGTGIVATVTVTDPSPDPAPRFYRLARQPAP